MATTGASGANSTTERGAPPLDVRETFNNLRRTLAPGLAKMSATWSDCKTVLWNTRNVMYILCLLANVLLIALILSWNKNFIVLLCGALTIFSGYGAIVVSKQSCFSVFDNAIVSSFTTNHEEDERNARERAAAAQACSLALRKNT